jgi:hypothetical protein
MASDVVDRPPRWSVAPYFIVDDVVATAHFNGYRLCFGHDIEGA